MLNELNPQKFESLINKCIRNFQRQIMTMALYNTLYVCI